MKKSLILVLSVLMVFGVAVSAFAGEVEAKGDTKITLSGDIRIRGDFRNNTSDFNDDVADHSALYESRVRLKLDAQVTPNTQAVVEIRDTKLSGDDDQTWGSTDWSDSVGGYTEGGEALGRSDSDLTFIQAWIQHSGSGLLGMPAGIKIGHMPLELGNGLFFSHTKNGDDAILLFANPTKELNVALLDIKLVEGTTSLNDDSDAYIGLFTYAGNGFNVSGDATYLNDQDYGAASGTQPLHFWNFGLRGDTDVQGIGVKADVELQTGKLKNGTETKYKGYAFLIGADYMLDPVKLGIEYVYGSGNKTETSDKNEQFINALDNTQKYTYVYEYRTVAATGSSQTGIANTQYVKARVGAKPTNDLSGHLDFYWLRANKVASGVSKSVGSEIDVYAEYNIDRNLKYYVEGGYLFAGNFFKTVTGTNEPDNAYAIRNGLVLSF